jgi:hypothetical protein
MKYKPKYKLISGFFRETLFIQIALVSLFILLIIFFDWSFNSNHISDSDIYDPDNTTVILNFNDGKRLFQGDIIDDMTVLDTLNASVVSGDILLMYNLNENNETEVLAIDGFSNYYSEDDFFAFYLNSREIAIKDINKVNVSSGDIVEVKIGN